MAKEIIYQTKFRIGDRVLTPISEFPATVNEIRISKDKNGYSNSNEIVNFYTVKVQLQAVGKPEFLTITTEYSESQLKAVN